MLTLTQKECIDMCRTHESTYIQIKTMTQQEVSAVSTRHSTSKRPSANKLKKSLHADKGKEIKRIFCGKKHAKDRKQCPVWGKKLFHMPQTKSFLNSLQISEQAKEAIQSCQYWRPGYV